MDLWSSGVRLNKLFNDDGYRLELMFASLEYSHMFWYKNLLWFLGVPCIPSFKDPRNPELGTWDLTSEFREYGGGYVGL